MKVVSLFDLTGQVAVVTGGNGGIGRGIALGLAGAGSAVAVLGRNDDKNQRVLCEVKEIGVPSMAVGIDLTRRRELQLTLHRIEQELGAVSILVNNAGIVSLSGGVLQGSSEDWDRVISCFRTGKCDSSAGLCATWGAVRQRRATDETWRRRFKADLRRCSLPTN